MKKLLLTFAGLLLISIMAVQAQVTQDTTQAPTEQPTVTDPAQTDEPVDQPAQTDQPAQQDPTLQDPTDPSSPNYNKDMERVNAADVPASLRSTLQGSEYQGWENGVVYRNKVSNEYTVEVGEGAEKKSFRFDRDGKRIGDMDDDD